MAPGTWEADLATPTTRRQGMCDTVMRIGSVVRILLWAVPRIRPGHRRSSREEVLGREY